MATRKATDEIAGEYRSDFGDLRRHDEVNPSFAQLATAIERQSSSTETIESTAAKAATIARKAATAAESRRQAARLARTCLM